MSGKLDRPSVRVFCSPVAEGESDDSSASVYDPGDAVMTSGKAGGLNTCEPLKAVENQVPPYRGV